jgi:ribonuclease PH
MTGTGKFVEVQGTAEGLPFSRETLDSLIKLAESGINDLIQIQKKLIEGDVLSY